MIIKQAEEGAFVVGLHHEHKPRLATTIVCLREAAVSSRIITRQIQHGLCILHEQPQHQILIPFDWPAFDEDEGQEKPVRDVWCVDVCV